MEPQNKKSWVVIACAVFLVAGCGGGEGVGDLEGPDRNIVIQSPITPQETFPLNAPILVQVSASQTIKVKISEGQTLTLMAQVTGAAPLVYNWKFENAVLPGEGGSTLVIKNFRSIHEGPYTLSVGNSYTKVISKVVDVRLAQPEAITPAQQ